MSKHIYYGQKSEIAFSFKTKSSGSIQPVITTTDASLAHWYSSDGQSVLSNNTGALTFVDNTEKTITVVVDSRVIDTLTRFDSIDLTYLNIQRLTELVSNVDITGNPDLKVFFPNITIGGVNEYDCSGSNIDILDFTQTLVKGSKVIYQEAANLHKFNQPQFLWWTDHFEIPKNIIFDTLNLDKAYFKGPVIINDADFIEGINFNPSITYQYVPSLDLSNNRLLNRVAFGIMQSLLTPANSWVSVRNIGASAEDVDYMLHQLNNVVASGASGRKIYLDQNTAPTVVGLAYLAQLQSKGLEVIVDP